MWIKLENELLNLNNIFDIWIEEDDDGYFYLRFSSFNDSDYATDWRGSRQRAEKMLERLWDYLKQKVNTYEIDTYNEIEIGVCG